MIKNKVTLSTPPSVEAFAEALRQDPAWRDVMNGTEYGVNDNRGEPIPYLTAVLARDGSTWRWTRGTGFQAVRR